MPLILRWSIGNYDTTTRTTMSSEKFFKFLKMAKLSVYSFQKFFDADFVVTYNGTDLGEFNDTWDSIDLNIKPITVVNQRVFKNPYPHFFPLNGVWWKWVPFRYDINCDEISIDTDIICFSNPKGWGNWFQSSKPFLVAEEAIKEINESTCGDVWNHPVLNNRLALNCGIIGHKKGFDLSDAFFELTSLVDLGTYNGNFITEQGLFNILFYSQQDLGIEHYRLPYDNNFQAKDLEQKVNSGNEIETIHFTAKSKLIFHDLYSIFKDRVDQKNTNIDLISALVEWFNINQV